MRLILFVVSVMSVFVYFRFGEGAQAATSSVQCLIQADIDEQPQPRQGNLRMLYKIRLE